MSHLLSDQLVTILQLLISGPLTYGHQRNATAMGVRSWLHLGFPPEATWALLASATRSSLCMYVYCQRIACGCFQKLLGHFLQAPLKAPRFCTCIISALLEGASRGPSQRAFMEAQGRLGREVYMQ